MDDKQEEIKDELQSLVKNIIPKRPSYRADYQMTLGSLIKALNKERSGMPVYIEFTGSATIHGSPGTPHSYYGYHSDLAFTPQTEIITVATFLKVCQDCVDKSFIAPDGSPGFYKDYSMPINVQVWISKLELLLKHI